MEKLVNDFKASLSKFMDADFFFRFFKLMVIFYVVNFFFIGLVDDRGTFYSPFLDHNFNFVSWIRYTILYASNGIAHILGLTSNIYPPDHLRTANRAWVEVAYGCVGMNLIGFWVAFVIANKTSLKKTFLWCIAGILGIWFINCWRIALLLYAFDHRWKVNSIMNHHTQYNLVVYTFIILMTFVYGQNIKKSLSKKIATPLTM